MADCANRSWTGAGEPGERRGRPDRRRYQVDVSHNTGSTSVGEPEIAVDPKNPDTIYEELGEVVEHAGRDDGLRRHPVQEEVVAGRYVYVGWGDARSGPVQAWISRVPLADFAIPGCLR